MKNAGFLSAVALLLLVGGAVVFLYLEDQKTPAPGPPPETRLFADDLKGLSRAALIRAGETPIVIEQTTPPPSPEAGIGVWRVSAGAAYKADVMVVGELLGTLRTLEAERLLDPVAEGATGFGLESPMLRIELGEGEQRRTLDIGAMNPAGSGRYARLSSVPKLYLLGVGSVTTLNKSLADLRQKRAMDTTDFAVEKLRIETPSRTWELARTPTRDWTLADIPGFRADQTLVGEFVSTVVGARTEAPQLAQPSLPEARFRAMAPVARVTATLADGERAAEFRRDQENTLYVKSEDLSGIYPVPAEIESFLKKSVEEYRNKRLFDFGFSDIFTLRYVAPGRTLNLTKPNEQWLSDGKQTDSAKANALLDELRQATATAFVEGDAPGAVAATVTSETAGGSKETVQLRKRGAESFAVRVGEKGYYKLPENVLENIEKAAAALQPGSQSK